MRDLKELNLNTGGEPVITPAPTEAQLALVEQLIGVPLPDKYISFLQFSNGGHPELDTVSVDADGHENAWAVNRFFHIQADSHTTKDTDDVIWNYYHRWPNAPRELLPIANTGGGDFFCLDLTTKGKGQIVIQIHDEPGFPIIPIADSFETFIDSLIIDPDDI